MKIFAFTLILSLFSFPFSPLSRAEDESPKKETAQPKSSQRRIQDYAIPSARKFSGEELKLKSLMEALFEASRNVNEKGQSRTQARSKIEAALDWDKVARVCLGDNRYKKLGTQQRNEFRNLLKDVIVKTAYTRLDTFWDDTKYQFKKIDAKGKEGQITAKFIVGKDSFELQYYFIKKNSSWFIYDISFDDLRYSENINEQLEAFLKDKPFTTLLDKLRKRLDEIESTKHS